MLLDIYRCGGELGRELGQFAVYVEGFGPTKHDHLYLTPSRVWGGSFFYFCVNVAIPRQARFYHRCGRIISYFSYYTHRPIKCAEDK